MLRLRPSELTLTPEDVEETFRRIARRQAARNTAQVNPHDGTLTGRPVLRRGPQRAVRDAITTLGDIPILRPQPQQAGTACVDEDIEIPPQQQTPSRTRQSISYETPSGQISRPASTAASTLRRLHLPFRIGRHRRESVTNPTSEEDDAQTDNNSTSNPSDPAATRTDGTSDQARHRKTPSASRRRLSIRSPAELRGGGRPTSNRERSSKSSGEHHRHSSRTRGHLSSEHTPFPQTVDPEAAFLNSAPPGSVFLRGRPDITGTRYTFDEFRLVPQSEPRPASRRRNIFTRSLSSGSAPRNGLHVSRTRPSTAATEDPFSFELSSDMPHAGRDRAQRRSSQPQYVGSEASAATDPFSIYELPSQSRNTSGGTSSSAVGPHDGTSMSTIGGGYRSIYPPGLGPQARPYANPNTVTSSTPLYGPPSYASQPGTTDAAMAAILNLPSPLQPYSEHYQQLRFDYPRTSIPSIDTQPFLRESPRVSTHSVDDNETMYASVTEHAARPQYPSLIPSLPASYQRPQLDGATLASTLQHQPTARIAQRSSENAPTVNLALPNEVRSRPGQVQLHRQAYERMHNAQQYMHQLSMQREAEDQQLTANVANSMPSSRVANNRITATARQPRPRHSRMPLSPRERVERDSHGRAEARQARDRARTSSGSQHAEDVVSEDTTPNERRTREAQRSHVAWNHRNRMRVLNERLLAEGPPPSDPLDSSRPRSARRLIVDTNGQISDPITPVVSETQTLVPAREQAIPRIRRRVPPQQRDQENSGVAEEQMMREEGGAIEARYGEGGGETMDETPPRIGRVERRMRDEDLL